AQAIGIGDDGGAGVEDETVAFPYISAAPRPVPRLDQGGGNAGRLQADRERQPAEARADHGGALHGAPPATARSRITASARITGTGGFPARMRSLSRRPG